MMTKPSDRQLERHVRDSAKDTANVVWTVHADVQGQEMHHFTDGGLQNVWLVNGYSVRKTPNGEAVAVNDLDGLTQAICLALTEKHGVLSGKELRYIRQAGMSLSQPALGRLLGVDGQSVARWEKTGHVPRWADKLLRVLYSAHANGEEPVRKAVDRAITVERLVSQRILVRESHGRWSPEVCEPALSAT